MRLSLLLVLALAACGPGDRKFTSLFNLTAIDKIALADTSVYFVESQALKRVPKTGLADGGTSEVLVTSGVVDFAATEGHLYLATSSGVHHLEVFSSGMVGPPVKLSDDAALAIAADGNGVSWVGCSTLTHAALDGSNMRSVAVPGTCVKAATLLALDSSTAYGVNGGGEWYASRSGAPPTSFGTETCSSLAAAGGWVYCGDSARGLRRMLPLEGTVEEVFAGSVRAFAISESSVYASVGEDLVASPRNTTRYDVLGTYAAISAIALDTDAVFFVNTLSDRGLILSTSL
jgi:hypothetical protein